MRYLKVYEDFNNKEKELETMFGLVMGNTEVYRIPYSYYGEATKERRDFDIYVVSGTKQESDDYKLVQELYHNHEILNELLNLEFFHINLTKKYVTVVLYDYVSSFDKNNKNHLSSIYTSKLPLPSHIKSRLKFSKTTSRLSVRPDGDYLNRGIDWSNGNSSNIALFDHIYDPKEKVSESATDKSSFMYIIKDKLLELSDIGFLAYVEDKNDEPLLEDMIRITVEKSHKRSDRTFEFSECKDSMEDLILTNKEMGYYKIYHLVITPDSGYNGIRLVYKDGIFYPEGNTNPNLNYIGKLRRVELFFEG
jgi:hypothetical protein